MWDINFHSDMIDGKASDFVHLLDLLEKVCVRWKRGMLGFGSLMCKKKISFMSLYNVLNVSSNSMHGWESFWVFLKFCQEFWPSVGLRGGVKFLL